MRIRIDHAVERGEDLLQLSRFRRALRHCLKTLRGFLIVIVQRAGQQQVVERIFRIEFSRLGKTRLRRRPIAFHHFDDTHRLIETGQQVFVCFPGWITHACGFFVCLDQLDGMHAVLLALRYELPILLFCLVSGDDHEFNQNADRIRVLAQICGARCEGIVGTFGLRVTG